MGLESSSEDAHEHAEQYGGKDELGAGGDDLGRVAVVRRAAEDCDALDGGGAGAIRTRNRSSTQIARLRCQTYYRLFLYLYKMIYRN